MQEENIRIKKAKYHKCLVLILQVIPVYLIFLGLIYFNYSRIAHYENKKEIELLNLNFDSQNFNYVSKYDTYISHKERRAYSIFFFMGAFTIYVTYRFIKIRKELS